MEATRLFEQLSCLSLFDRSITLLHFHSPAQVFASNGRPGLDSVLSSPWLPQAEDVRAWCRDRGISILHPMHPAYPPEFTWLEEPPLFLAWKGSAPWIESRCLSVVGSREATRKSLEWMDQELGEFVRTSGTAIASGGARGIDQKAHAVCVRAGKPTIVFLPSGLGRPYPREISAWDDEIIQAGGAVLSEFHPMQDVRKQNFERRNRMIAALGRMLFVVEARRRSGSLMTARLAEGLGREICVLPSFPGEPASAGTLDLLINGATPIRDAADLRSYFELKAFGGRERLPPSAAQSEKSGD